MSNRIICDGHEYRYRMVSPVGGLTRYEITDNYGTHVATAERDLPGEGWVFELADGCPSSDWYADHALAGRGIPHRLVQWYAVVSAE